MMGSRVIGAPIITPSTATVFVGGTVQFTSTDTVTWSLKAGSTGTITAGGLYTAPSSFAAKNVVNGCMALPNDHIYNTRIDALPVDANSTTRINNIVSAPLGFEVTLPINFYTNATPTQSMVFRYSKNTSFPILPFPYNAVETAAIPYNEFNQDRHVLGVNTDTCQFSELFHLYTVGTDPVCPTCTSESGVKYYGTDYLFSDNTGGFSQGTDAAGMYLSPLAIRYSELKSGSIKHAMRITLANGYIQPNFIWPATANATLPSCTPSSNCFPYGARLRLKSSFGISNYSPTAQVVLTALKQYGAFMVDGGLTLHIQTDADVTSDTTTWNALNTEIPITSTISPSNFEQADESTLAESTFSGHVNLTNVYVTPDNFAQVIATKNSDSTTAYVNVAIQPVTLGLKNTPFPATSAGLNVMAGTPQFTIPYVINGTTTTAVTCSMSPTIGTLSSACLYTAPTSQILMATAAVTITPTIEPARAINFPLVVFSSDGIRMNVGGKSAFITSPVIPYDAAGNYGPDVNGNYWWSDPVGSVPSWYGKNDIGFPQSSWPGSADVGLFYTQFRGTSDQPYSAIVPNGNYTLSLGFGETVGLVVTNSSVTIDSQGIIFSSNTKTVSAAFTPNTISTPVQVTNNNFYFAIREILSTQYTFLNKWSLIFNSSLPTNTETWTGKISATGTEVLK